MQNPSLDVRFIAERMNMSHASLYRRTKAINGTSVIDLIIQVRINKAYQLLKDRGKTLTQIAFETGFCDLKRFRQSFQKQLKMSPKEFRDMLN
jgi:AraC-like DNA-binding protein